MSGQVKPIPEGYRTVTPYLTVHNGKQALDFYKRAFGAQQVTQMEMPGGKIGHAEFKIGDSMIMLSDEGMGCKSPQTLGGSPVGIFLYVKDVDSIYKQAVAAGAKSDQEPTNMFWGDRFAKLTDPFGHNWSMATHIEDVAPDEMKKRADAFTAQMAQQHKTAT
jgi:PhnB protein